MGTLTEAEIIQSIRDATATISGLENEIRHLHRELGKLSLAIGDWCDVRQSGDRREQSFQGSVNQAVQSIEEAATELPPKVDIDWNALATGDFRPLGTVWHSGSWRAIGDILDEVQGKVHGAGQNEPAHARGVQLEAEDGGSRRDL